MLTTSFDLTFDFTFQGLIPVTTGIAANPCRMRGVYLYWLTRSGWTGYLFGGNTDTDKETKSLGSYAQGGIDRDTGRSTRLIKTVRAGNLTQKDAQVVSTVLESNAVYALAPNRAGQIIGVLVHIEPGTIPVWREASSRIGIEVKVIFPATKSQRA